MTFKHAICGTALGLALLTGSASVALAQDKSIERAVTARQSLMALNAFNIGPLGAMAKGEIPYDAKVASAAATNLSLLQQIDQSRMWPKGSDSETIDKTRALPAIWEKYPDILTKHDDAAKAADALAAVAGNGLDALRGAIGTMGKACGACHELYRKPVKQ